jgi:hypothetical protein
MVPMEDDGVEGKNREGRVASRDWRGGTYEEPERGVEDDKGGALEGFEYWDL